MLSSSSRALIMSMIRLYASISLLLSIVPVTLPAQQAPASVELPIDAIHAIAADVDEGRSPLYCFHGRRVDGPPLLIVVDSVAPVRSQRDCAGLGIGFIMRSSDRELLAAAVRGVIDQNSGFAVVSAFYRTEDIDDRGSRLHAPRALSVVRGAMQVNGSGAPIG